MKTLDIEGLGLKGIFRVYKIKNGKKEFVDEDKNLVVRVTQDWIRNLTFGDTDNVIKQILIGDMNKTLSSNCSNPPQPTPDDTKLVHKFFQKNYEKHEKITYHDNNDNKDYPAIKYTFTILESEANDLKNTNQNERKLWCEYALADATGNIWTRKVKPMIKDNETRYIIEWTLVFIYKEK